MSSKTPAPTPLFSVSFLYALIKFCRFSSTRNCVESYKFGCTPMKINEEERHCPHTCAETVPTAAARNTRPTSVVFQQTWRLEAFPSRLEVDTKTRGACFCSLYLVRWCSCTQGSIYLSLHLFTCARIYLRVRVRARRYYPHCIYLRVRVRARRYITLLHLFTCVRVCLCTRQYTFLSWVTSCIQVSLSFESFLNNNFLPWNQRSYLIFIGIYVFLRAAAAVAALAPQNLRRKRITSAVAIFFTTPVVAATKAIQRGCKCRAFFQCRHCRGRRVKINANVFDVLVVFHFLLLWNVYEPGSVMVILRCCRHVDQAGVVLFYRPINKKSVEAP